MNCYDFIQTLRSGTYGDDVDSFKKFLDAALQKFPKFCVTTLLHHVIASDRIDAIEHVLTKFNRKTTWFDIDAAVDTLNIDILNLVCKRASSKEINRALANLALARPEHIEVLLENGADPNTEDGRAMLAAAEEGALENLKVLYLHGGRLQPAMFDAACYWENFQLAYWLYQHDVRGYETPGFLAYKAEQDSIREKAQRKIYFWILPKLYRNREFVMKQASKSYDALFGVSEE